MEEILVLFKGDSGELLVSLNRRGEVLEEASRGIAEYTQALLCTRSGWWEIPRGTFWEKNPLESVISMLRVLGETETVSERI